MITPPAKTAQHEGKQVAESAPNVMSNAETSVSSGVEKSLNADTILDDAVSRDGTLEQMRSSPPAVIEERITGDNGRVAAEASTTKSDSEAETIVLPGKEDGSGNTAEMIRHGIGDTHKTDGDVEMLDVETVKERKDKVNDGKTIHSGKRKRTKHIKAESAIPEGGNSSALSSVQSSPPHGAQFSRKADSDSEGSRSSPPQVCKERTQSLQARSRKRKLDEEASDNEAGRRRTRRQQSTEFTINKTRSTTQQPTHQPSQDRSLSPLPRWHRRGSSTQSSQLQAPNGNRKRKAPPPLLTMHERTQSEDRHSDTSSASGSPRPSTYLRRIVSGDANAMSAAKMPHKKHRDQNGRTWLARACAALEIDNARARLKERPEDLHIEDNAGNTPLQIAALEGCAPIVKLLLEAGCDVDCRNIDIDTPLIDAVENGHLEVVQLLLDAGANPRQGNAKGEEPLDLLKSDKDNYEGIKQALLSAKAKDTLRRQSEDQTGHTGTAKETGSQAGSATSPRESPPMHTTRSPPPTSGIAPRRRTVRSEATRNDLLWMKPTPENLRDRAGKGDMAGVGTILNVLNKADTESLIAAARGGHDEVIQLLLGMGDPDADPPPLQSAMYKPGYNTPMLAAIGRGNEKVIQLLLAQPKFDPTRRDHRGLAYHEIAKERQGFNWEKEFDILKQAFDKQASKGRKGRKSALESPRKQREKGNISRRNSIAESTTAKAHTVKLTGSHLVTNENLAKGSHPSKDTKHDLHDRSRNVPLKAYKHPEMHGDSSREHSVAVSDQESISLPPPKSKIKSSRSQSDAATAMDPETVKPRRKLVSGKVLKSDQERKRRASNVSSTSSSSLLGKDSTISDRTSAQHPRIKKEDSHSRLTAIRPEKSEDPQRDIIGLYRSRSQDSVSRKGSVGGSLQKKPRMVDIEGTHIGRNHMTEQTMQPRLVQVANMIRVPEPPVNTNISEVTPTNDGDRANEKTLELIRNGKPSETTEEHCNASEEHQAKVKAEDEEAEQQRLEKERYDLLLRQQTEDLARRQVEAEEERLATEAERERESQAAEIEAVRLAQLAREEEEARLDEERRLAEAERQARIAQEEEVRMERERQEQELLRQREEQERLKREEQERRHAELEERERALRIQQQEEEERRRRQALPNSLCRAAGLNTTAGRSPAEIIKWLPLFTVTTRQLDPTCEEDVANYRWIPNFQAAPILANKDLQLSQCE